MVSSAAARPAGPDAIEFVRFCYRRKHVGWPELYDEMCAVASRGLFRGWGPDDLATRGIRFGLFEMHALAIAVTELVEEDRERERATIGTARVVRANRASAVA